MKREEKENNIKKLNINQIGFQEGLGCEINILKLIQKIKYWKTEKKFKSKVLTTLHLDIA